VSTVAIPSPAVHVSVPNKWVVAASVTFGTLMGAIDTSIMNVALPHLRGAFSATTEEISWVTTAYLLAAAIAMPLTASLAAAFGRKNVYLAGLQLFVASSVVCGLSPSLPILVAARVLQGVGAGALQPIEQAILRETFPPKEQGMAMGIYGIAIMLGPALGPTLGGYILDHYSWSWAFYINVPVGLLGFVMVSRFVHDSAGRQRRHANLDVAGIALLVVGLVALHVLLERGERLDWFESTSNVACAAVAAGSLAMFVAHELTTPRPVVNLRVLASRGFASAVGIGTILGFVVFATLFLLPLYMQDLLRWSAMQTGLTLMPRALVMIVAFPLVGALYNRFSPRLFIGLGLGLGAYSAYLMSRFTLQTGTTEILIPQVLQGIALACILTPLSTLALASVARERMAEAAGLNNLGRQLGGSLGVAVFATLLGRFATESRAALVHRGLTGDSVLRARLAGVAQYFWSRGASSPLAVARSLGRLDGSFERQAMTLAFERAFQWGCVLFLVSWPLLLLLKVPFRSRSESLVPNDVGVGKK
jgi:MFS transporter, DHA2 family, multidrug resistance protein